MSEFWDLFFSAALIVGLLAWGFTGSRKRPATKEEAREYWRAGIW